MLPIINSIYHSGFIFHFTSPLKEKTSVFSKRLNAKGLTFFILKRASANKKTCQNKLFSDKNNSLFILAEHLKGPPI